MTPAVAVINCVDPGSLKQLQQEGGDPVSLMYEMLRENKELDRETAHTSIQCSTDYVRTKIETLSNVHEILREKQWELRVEDEDEPLLFKKGDYVLVKRQSTKKGLSSKLQSKYSGPFVVEKSFRNHT